MNSSAKRNLIIVGSSGHAHVVIDVFLRQGTHLLLGLIDDYKSPGVQCLGLDVLGRVEDIPQLLASNENCDLFVAVGDNWKRSEVVTSILKFTPEAKFATAVHPNASIGINVQLGKGVVVMAGAVVNSNSKVNNFAIVNTKATLDHDGLLGIFASLAPGVTTGGNVSIGDYSAVSIGAVIKHGVSIGCNSVIGAGSLLLHNCDDETVMYGLPARVVRKRQKDEPYL